MSRRLSVIVSAGLLTATLLLGWGCAMLPPQSPQDPFATVEPGLRSRDYARPEYPPTKPPAASPTPLRNDPQTPSRTPPRTFADPSRDSRDEPPVPSESRETEKTPLPTRPESPGKVGPRLVPPGEEADADRSASFQSPPQPEVGLWVDVPQRRPVGSGAPFQLTIRNSGERTLRNVSVVCDFDDALTFPGSNRKSVTHKIPKIEAGDAKESLLTLVSDLPGTHQCRFTVKVGSEAAETQTASVEFVARQLDWQLKGPTERTVGSRAEFNLPLINLTNLAVLDLTVRVELDSALTVREMTQGGKLDQGSVTWKIDRLKANEGLLLQLEVECREPTTQACLKATIEGGDLPADDVEACLTVKPVAGLLDVRVQDVVDPVAAGGEVELVITVSNPGLQAAENVAVQCEWPAGFEFVQATQQVAGRTKDVPVDPQERTARLATVPTLKPDETLEYRVTLLAKQAGSHELTVRASEESASSSVQVREPILVHR